MPFDHLLYHMTTQGGFTDEKMQGLINNCLAICRATRIFPPQEYERMYKQRLIAGVIHKEPSLAVSEAK